MIRRPHRISVDGWAVERIKKWSVNTNHLNQKVISEWVVKGKNPESFYFSVAPFSLLSTTPKKEEDTRPNGEWQKETRKKKQTAVTASSSPFKVERDTKARYPFETSVDPSFVPSSPRLCSRPTIDKRQAKGYVGAFTYKNTRDESRSVQE